MSHSDVRIWATSRICYFLRCLAWSLSFLSAGMTLLLMHPESLQAREADDLKQRFLDEAPRCWERYKDFVDGLEGTLTWRNTTAGKVTAHVRLDYKHNAHCRLVSTQSLLAKPSEGELVAYNENYAFELGRKAIARPWVLKTIEPLHEGNLDSSIRKDMPNWETLKHAAVKAYKQDLLTLVRQPTFRVLQAVPVTHGGIELVKIDFNNSHPLDIKARPFIPTQKGSLLLNSNRFWCLHTGEIEETWSDGESKTSIKIEFQDSSAKYLIPKRSIATTDFIYEKQERRIITTETDYDLREPSSVPPDSEFTLSAFGLPEPYGVEQPRSRWYIWAAVAGFVCLGLGFLIRQRYRPAA